MARWAHHQVRRVALPVRVVLQQLQDLPPLAKLGAGQPGEVLALSALLTWIVWYRTIDECRSSVALVAVRSESCPFSSARVIFFVGQRICAILRVAWEVPPA